jgi:hypothetical protein
MQMCDDFNWAAADFVLWVLIQAGCPIAGFGSGYGMYNALPSSYPMSRVLSPQYNFQMPSHNQSSPQKPTKSKIPTQVSSQGNTLNGSAKMHQFHRDVNTRDSSKDASSQDYSTESYYPSSGNEKLYEAYNDLHSLAQDFNKAFDAPAIVVVGHQTDGTKLSS